MLVVWSRTRLQLQGIVKFIDGPAVAGFLMDKELRYLSGYVSSLNHYRNLLADRAIAKPAHPFAAIIGGAKVSTKLPILSSLLPKIDKLIIGS